jgi:formylmethanofuran dehydrogenase subunit B
MDSPILVNHYGRMVYMQNQTTLASQVTCPACGLLCDDILVNQQGNNKTITNACAKGIAFFERTIGQTQPQIAGKPVALAEALSKAAEILRTSKQPLFAGLSTDLNGFRAVFETAGKVNAIMSHINADSSWRNHKVLQTTGWQTTTLTEVKNRADVVVFIGTDVVHQNPRFFERTVWVKDALFTDPSARQIIYLGGEHLNTEEGTAPNGQKATVLPCSKTQLPALLAAFRALAQGKTLQLEQVSGVQVSALQAVIDTIKAAKYAVLVWVAKEFDYANAELSIQSITEAVVSLNQSSRTMGLPLGGSDGDTTVNYAHTWLSTLLPNPPDLSQHDAMVWINSFSPNKDKPDFNGPVVAIGDSNAVFAQQPDVFIPVATPALDCAGTLFRVDSSVVMPLKKTRHSQLPTLANVMAQLEALLA